MDYVVNIKMHVFLVIYSEKQLKDIKILLTITVEKMISIQGICIYDRTTNMQFSRMQNKIYGSLVMIQYHTKCTNPLYLKFTSKKFSVYSFCCNLYLVINCVLILITDKCSNPLFSVKPPAIHTYTAICASRQIQRYFKSQNLLTGNDHVAPPI